MVDLAKMETSETVVAVFVVSTGAIALLMGVALLVDAIRRGGKCVNALRAPMGFPEWPEEHTKVFAGVMGYFFTVAGAGAVLLGTIRYIL